MSKQETGIVDIRGKQYKTVALRVAEFREDHPELGLVTRIVSIDSDRVVVACQVVGWMGGAVEPRVLATGHAEEVRAASSINRTSALENAETSAIGRALSSFGYAGTEFASADELVGALLQQASTAKDDMPDPSRADRRARKAAEALAQAKDLIGANNAEGFLAMVLKLENPEAQLRWIESKLTDDQREWVAKVIEPVDLSVAS